MIPFLWMHGEPEHRLRELIAAIDASGIGALCVESRPHPDFLGPRWWHDMDVVLDECRKRNIDVWILDDAHFPTGYAAGRAVDSPHRVRFLYEKHVDVAGPQTGTSLLLNAPGNRRDPRDDDQIIAVVAARRIPGKNMDHSTFINIMGDPVEQLIDLTERVVDDVVYWDIPKGLWRVFYFTVAYGSGSERHDKYVNPLEAEGTDILIDAVYAEHYRHYPDEFGRTIKGFFSDEPQLANANGYHAKIGRYPFMPLPWTDAVLPMLSAELGRDARVLLPGLWYDVGALTPDLRCGYMDVVTRLYGENFAGRIGDWCRAHGVEYMGHVIEENNAHARLGAGTGHYFRALWGQDFAGIDIVLNGIIPGIKGGSHAQNAFQFEADDDFFYYCLAQLAASLARLDPKKRGRAMCEIFGAYGWQEGLREMKWLADFMLSRGINVYVPHAFTPKDFPDPDCPPHFYAMGHNPQFRYFKRLMDYMNRVCSLISGGETPADVAVLYHAEAEWASDDMTKTQDMIKLLNQRQVEADIASCDMVRAMDARGGRAIYGARSYALLIVPHAQYLPADALARLGRLAADGVAVAFEGGLPERACLGADEIDLSACRVCTEAELCRLVEELQLSACVPELFEPDLKVYPYLKSGQSLLLMFNESANAPIDGWLALNHAPLDGQWLIYDAFDNVAQRAQLRERNGCVEVKLHLEPGEARILASAMPFADTVLMQSARPTRCVWQSDRLAVSVSAATAQEYPNFKPLPELGLGNLNRPDGLPRFSGTLRYSFNLPLAAEGSEYVLDLGAVGETAQLSVNGVDVGVRIAPPYRFDVGQYLRAGDNAISVDVTNTLVYAQHDKYSAFHAIAPSGLIGPVSLWQAERE